MKRGEEGRKGSAVLAESLSICARNVDLKFLVGRVTLEINGGDVFVPQRIQGGEVQNGAPITSTALD